MSREVVCCQANTATPSFKFEVDWAIRIQHALARFAHYRRVIDWFKILNFFKRCVKSTYWLNDSGSTDFGIWPIIPRKSNSVLIFTKGKIHCFL
jgi:hypothetical protein